MTLGPGQKGRVDNLRIPLTAPTIQSGVNDTDVAQNATQRLTVILLQRQVDGPTLAPILQWPSQAAQGTWIVAHDMGNMAMTIQSSGSLFRQRGSLFRAVHVSAVYARLACVPVQYAPVQGIYISVVFHRISNSQHGETRRGSRRPRCAVTICCSRFRIETCRGHGLAFRP